MQVLGHAIDYLPFAGVLDLAERRVVKAPQDQRDAVNRFSPQGSE